MGCGSSLICKVTKIIAQTNLLKNFPSPLALSATIGVTRKLGSPEIISVYLEGITWPYLPYCGHKIPTGSFCPLLVLSKASVWTIEGGLLGVRTVRGQGVAEPGLSGSKASTVSNQEPVTLSILDNNTQSLR